MRHLLFLCYSIQLRQTRILIMLLKHKIDEHARRIIDLAVGRQIDQLHIGSIEILVYKIGIHLHPHNVVNFTLEDVLHYHKKIITQCYRFIAQLQTQGISLKHTVFVDIFEVNLLLPTYLDTHLQLLRRGTTQQHLACYFQLRCLVYYHFDEFQLLLVDDGGIVDKIDKIFEENMQIFILTSSALADMSHL